MFEQRLLLLVGISAKRFRCDGQNRGAVSHCHADCELAGDETPPEAKQKMPVKRFVFEQADNGILKSTSRVFTKLIFSGEFQDVCMHNALAVCR